MPQGYESEDEEEIENRASGRKPCASRSTSQRDVYIANEPAVVTAMPTSPELDGRRIVGETAKHIFWRIDSIGE
jgi:hypothetical protein